MWSMSPLLILLRKEKPSLRAHGYSFSKLCKVGPAILIIIPAEPLRTIVHCDTPFRCTQPVDDDPDSMTQTYDNMIEKVQNGQTFFSIFNYAGSLAYNKEVHYGKSQQSPLGP